MARSLIQRWANDPSRFSTEALGLSLWSRQVDVAQALVSTTRVAVKSGHKVGKSTLVVVLALWWVLTRYRARAILTAPSGHQIRNIIWPELQRVYRCARFPIGGYLSPDPARGLTLPEDRSIICVTTDEPEKLAGLSGPNQLFVVDEASGYPEALWAPIQGNLAGGGRLLATGNPTQLSGSFHEAFTAKARLWSTHTISSAESPNVIARRAAVPGLATFDWLLEMLDEHEGIRLDPGCSHAELVAALEAADAPFLDVRAKGRFPSQVSDAVIALSLVEAAATRWAELLELEQAPEIELALGVDVAREGDDESVIAPRRGPVAYQLRPFRGLDGPQLAGRVVEVADEHRKPHERARVLVDVIGVGASVYDSLQAMAAEHRLDVVAVNVAENADDPERFANLRAQLAFGLRDWLRDGGAIPADQKLHAELVAIKYAFDARGRYQVEPKKKIKQRLRRSPDRFDALALSTHAGAVAFDAPLLRKPGRFS